MYVRLCFVAKIQEQGFDANLNTTLTSILHWHKARPRAKAQKTNSPIHRLSMYCTVALELITMF